MYELTLDCETTIAPGKDWLPGVSLLRDGDPSPYNPFNKLVTVHYKIENEHANTFNCVNTKADTKIYIQSLLNDASILIGFNIKFDLSWLLECGFIINCPVWDCQLAEYVMNQPNVIQPSLDEVAAMYNLPQKFDIVKENYWKKGINTDAVPFNILKEYGEQDVNITYEIYKKQKAKLETEELKHLLPTVKLTNDFCKVLTNMERKGVKIDIDALDVLEEETRQRYEELRIELQDIIYSVMGDTPINLDSPEQCSMLFYSRKVKNKKQWTIDFNFTPNQNKFERANAARKMQTKYFIHLVNTGTNIVYKTKAYTCPECKGKGKIQKFKKDGSMHKNTNKCKACNAIGYQYENTDKIAGLKITPSKHFVTANGFATSGDAIEHALNTGKLNKVAEEFVTKYQEYNALASYLETTIGGIRRGMKDGILHTSFQQARTATGRLSSTEPNLQNMPRGNTFPVKRVFTSRFKDGLIIDADMSGLEFRVAAEMSGCKKAYDDIINKADIHRMSASKIFNIPESEVTSEQRQEAKASTFAPLYGAGRDWGLMERYIGIGQWHKKLITEAVQTKQIRLITGRTFNFPKVRRTEYGCTSQTKIKNYPVQALATADLVPAIIVELATNLIGFKSCLVLTVHDSIVVDVHPEEKDEIIAIIRLTLADVHGIIERRYGIKLKVPLDSEIKIGKNALEGIKI